MKLASAKQLLKSTWPSALFLLSLSALFYFYFSSTYSYYKPANIEFELEASLKGSAFITYDDGSGYSEDNMFEHEFNPANAKSLVVRQPLPQVRLYGIHIETSSEALIKNPILTTEGSTYDLGGDSKEVSSKQLPALNKAFHPIVFYTQLFLALLCAFVIVRFYHYQKARGGLRYFFFSGQWPSFWIYFGLLLGVYSIYILGQWPSFMSPASLDVWNQIKSLHMHNWNPAVHTLLCLMVAQFIDSPGSLSILQLLVTCGLFSSLLCYSQALGVNRKWIYLTLALMMLSVPVGIYNNVFWRDILFSLGVVLWVFLLSILSFDVKRRSINWSTEKIVYLSVALALVSLMRHNGASVLLSIPALIFFFGLLPERKMTLQLLVISFALYAFGQFGVGTWTGAHKNFDYRAMELSIYLNPIVAIMSHKRYISSNKTRDAEVLSKFNNVEVLKKEFCPNTVPCVLFHKDSNWKITSDELTEIRKLYLRLIRTNFHIFFAHQTYMMLATLGFDSYSFSEKLKKRSFSFHTNPNVKNLKYSPVRLLEKPATKLVKLRRDRRHWNAGLGLLLLIVTSVLWPYFWNLLPANLFLFLNFGSLYLLIISTDFRYIYWLYIYGIIAIPLAVAAYKNSDFRLGSINRSKA